MEYDEENLRELFKSCKDEKVKTLLRKMIQFDDEVFKKFGVPFLEYIKQKDMELKIMIDNEKLNEVVIQSMVHHFVFNILFNSPIEINREKIISVLDESIRQHEVIMKQREK